MSPLLGREERALPDLREGVPRDSTSRGHLGVTLLVTLVTSWFSYAYFHNDEYFQVLELVRSKLAPEEVPALPWEHAQRIRPWFQPFLYWVVGRGLGALGVHDIFHLAFAFRLLTGLANVGALALFLRTTLPWCTSPEERRLHLRVAALAGFLPYLFVRTSSESGSMAALTAAWSLLLEGATPREDGRWTVPALEQPLRSAIAGALFGAAFEMRFQTAILALGVVIWLVWLGCARLRHVAPVATGAIALVLLAAPIDRWGYGAWTFPAWTYFQANLLEGAAGFFGTDPPFAYLWLTPANVFALVLLPLLFLAALAWLRCPRHPLSWATLPFFLVHNLIAHKEERFVFPLATLATGLVVLAIGPGFRSRRAAVERIAAALWSRRGAWPGKALVVASVIPMAVLAFVPIGWNHNVRFARALYRHVGSELHATALPEVDLTMPAFHPRIYDVDKADPAELGRRIAAGTARPWIIADRPVLDTGVTDLDQRAVVVYSELPGFDDPGRAAWLLGLVERYNAWAAPPLRPLRYRTLYRVTP